MKKNAVWIFAVILLAGSVAGQDRLLPGDKDWLDSVEPIITKAERDVFLKLKTRADKDKFIEFFWRQRDPRPDTAENEFRKEYQERIRWADQNFHDGTSQKGNLTERGYYYRLLGAPLERQLFTTHSQLWPMELWFYKGEEQYGLPAYFYLIFYQPEGLGRYRLYSPGIEGPEKLVVPSMVSSSVTRSSAHQIIKGLSSELGSASLSYIPGERPLTSSSFSSDSVVAGIRALPEKKYSDAYARSYLKYKDSVETEYSHNFIDCDALVRVFAQGNQFFLHWTVEPSKMNFDSVAGAAFASYEVVLKLERPDGSPLLEKTEEIPLRVTPEQFKSHERQRVAFQDVLAVAPGDARLFLLLKNKTAKDFMTFQAQLSVPAAAGKPRLGDLLLYHAREDVPAAQKSALQAFTLDGRRYVINARNEFLPQEKIGGFVQALDLAADPGARPESFLLEIFALPSDSSKPPAAVAAISRRFAPQDVFNPATGGIDLGPIPLEGVAPGYCQAVVTVFGPGGRALMSRKENFIVLARPMPVLPWIFARRRAPFPSAEQLFLLGTQYFLARDYEKARSVLDQGLILREEPGTRLLLGRTLYALGRFADSIGITAPLFKASRDREAAKVLALDKAALGDWPGALELCQGLLKDSTEIAVLNMAGECYLRLDRPDEALPLLKKSLELDPAQPAIKALAEKAGKK